MTPLGQALGALIRPRQAGYRPPATECPHCGDAGRVIDRQAGSAALCPCATKRAQADAVAVLRQNPALGAPAAVSFADLNANGPPGKPVRNYPETLRATRAYAERPQGMLTIAGSPGTGKTALAMAAANLMLDQAVPAVWTAAGDLLRALRQETRAPEHDAAGACRQAPALVIDDLPANPATPWELEQLTRFISARDDCRQPTLCVLRGHPNQADPELAAKIARNDDRHRTLILQTADAGACRLPPEPMATAMTFAAFQPRKGLAEVKNIAMEWAAAPEGWLCLTGNAGAGKTHLAVAATTARAEAGDVVYFTTTAELLAELRAAASAPRSSNAAPDPLLPAMTADLLTLDDFGAERMTAFAGEQLSRLLGHRYDRRLPTIITTNLTPAEMAKASPRLASRICDPMNTALVTVNAPDYRARHAERSTW